MSSSYPSYIGLAPWTATSGTNKVGSGSLLLLLHQTIKHILLLLLLPRRHTRRHITQETIKDGKVDGINTHQPEEYTLNTSGHPTRMQHLYGHNG